jgi:hypothetical protein
VAGLGCSPRPGRGKTHLAIAYRAIQNGFAALFTTAAQLIDELSAAFREGRFVEALSTYTHPAVLVVDEVGLPDLRYRGRSGPRNRCSDHRNRCSGVPGSSLTCPERLLTISGTRALDRLESPLTMAARSANTVCDRVSQQFPSSTAG